MAGLPVPVYIDKASVYSQMRGFGRVGSAIGRGQEGKRRRELGRNANPDFVPEG